MGTKQNNILQIDEFRTDVLAKVLPWTKLRKATNVFIHKNQIRTRWHFYKVDTANFVYTANNDLVSASRFTDTTQLIRNVIKTNTLSGIYSIKVDGSTTITNPNYTPTDASRLPYFIEFNNTLYVCDQDLAANLGKFYFSGSTNYGEKFGAKAPLVKPALAEINVGAGNIVAGTYYYVYTYCNTLTPGVVQSNYSPVSNAVVIGAGPSNIQVTVTETADTQINKVRIYRGTSASGPFYFIDNGGVDFAITTGAGTENKTDSQATAYSTVPAPTDHGQINFDCVSLVEHKQRLWAFRASSNLIYPSNPAETNVNYGEHFSLLNYPVGKPGDNVVGGVVYLGMLIIFKQYSTHVLLGDDESSWRIEKLLDEGTLSPWSLLKDGKYIYFQNSSGVNRWMPFSNVEVERVSHTVYPDIDESFSASGDGALDRNFIIIKDPYFDKLWFCHHDGGLSAIGHVTYIWIYDIASNKIVGKFTSSKPIQWVFNYKNLIYAGIYDTVLVGSVVKQYIFDQTNGDAFDVEIETGYNSGPIPKDSAGEHGYGDMKHVRSVLLVYRYNSAGSDAWTVKGVLEDGSLVTVGTFTPNVAGAAGTGDFFKAFDRADRFVGINISQASTKKFVSIPGVEICYDPVETGG